MRLRYPSLGIFLMTLASACAVAQETPAYPSRPVSLIVGFEPGGGSDYVARTLAATLGEKLGQTVVVENRPGSGGVLATRSVTREKADGYTLLLGSAAAFVINPFMMKNVGYDPNADFTPIGSVASFNYVLLGRKTLPAKTLPELIAYARQHPATMNIGSAGVGSNTHLAAVAFMNKAGVSFTHIPYKGTSGALNDLMGGNIDLLFDSVPTTLNQVSTGKLIAFATTGPAREAAHPAIPTIAESTLPGLKHFQASNWFAVFAPRGVDPAIAETLNRAINAALQDPQLLARFKRSGNLPLPGSQQDLIRLVRDQARMYDTLIRDNAIKTQ